MRAMAQHEAKVPTGAAARSKPSAAKAPRLLLLPPRANSPRLPNKMAPRRRAGRIVEIAAGKAPNSSATSGPPRHDRYRSERREAREKAADPNSPFAKLAALKAQLEADAKERR